jgi:hypothetical protein
VRRAHVVGPHGEAVQQVVVLPVLQAVPHLLVGHEADEGIQSLDSGDAAVELSEQVLAALLGTEDVEGFGAPGDLAGSYERKDHAVRYIGVLADDEAKAGPGTIDEAHLDALGGRKVASCLIRDSRVAQAGPSWAFEAGQELEVIELVGPLEAMLIVGADVEEGVRATSVAHGAGEVQGVVRKGVEANAGRETVDGKAVVRICGVLTVDVTAEDEPQSVADLLEDLCLFRLCRTQHEIATKVGNADGHSVAGPGAHRGRTMLHHIKADSLESDLEQVSRGFGLEHWRERSMRFALPVFQPIGRRKHSHLYACVCVR